jgi:hypothetical protein
MLLRRTSVSPTAGGGWWMHEWYKLKASTHIPKKYHIPPDLRASTGYALGLRHQKAKCLPSCAGASPLRMFAVEISVNPLLQKVALSLVPRTFAQLRQLWWPYWPWDIQINNVHGNRSPSPTSLKEQNSPITASNFAPCSKKESLAFRRHWFQIPFFLSLKGE